VVIAVVDDELSVRRGLARLLRSADHEVRLFESGEQMLEQGLVPPPDCAILDIHLGGMNGFEVWRALLARGAAFPVLFMTAHDEPETRQLLRVYGDVVCLRKPFDATVLLDSIHASVRDSRI
jgi:DNA-binding response OmpR family regulator